MPLNISTSTSQSFYTSTSFSMSKSSSSSTSSTNNNPITKTTSSGHRYTKSSHTDRDGTTTVRTIREDLGYPIIVEEHRYDGSGRELAALPDARSEGVMRRIEDLGDDYGDEEDAGFDADGEMDVEEVEGKRV